MPTSMSLCRLEARDKGVFVLTLGSDGSHNYLTDDTITDLLENLEKVRNNAKVKGLVTTCESEAGTFCDGLNYDNLSESEAVGLAARFGMVIRRLLELPVPTVAAVRGRATSLGQALVLAHDHCFVWEHALFGLPEAQFGYPLPNYLTTLLHEKLAPKRTAQVRSSTDGKIPRRWPRHGTEGHRAEVLNKAIGQLYRTMFSDGTIVTNNRKMECPDTFAAVVPRAMPHVFPKSAEKEGSSTFSKKRKEEGSSTVGSRSMPSLPSQRRRLSPEYTCKFDGERSP